MRKIILYLIFMFCFVNCSYGFSDNDINNLEMSMYGNIYSNEDYGSRIKRLETDLLGMTQSGDIDSRIDTLKKIHSNSNIATFSYPDDRYYSPKKQGVIKNFFNNLSSSMFDTGTITGYTPSMSSSFSNNLYRNEFMNFANNPYGYCPYNNGFNYSNRSLYGNRNRFNNRFGYRRGNNLSSLIPHNHHNHHNHYRPPYYSPYGINRYNHIPTDVSNNIATRSTVHILQDWYYKIKKRTEKFSFTIKNVLKNYDSKT